MQSEQYYVLQPCCHHKNPVICTFEKFLDMYFLLPGKDNFDCPSFHIMLQSKLRIKITNTG